MSEMDLDARSDASNDSIQDADVSERHSTAQLVSQSSLPVRIQPQHKQQGWMSPRKRRHSFDAQEISLDPDMPLKRRKTVFNATYLSLFNSHVFDVVNKSPHDFGQKLSASQIGVINWSSAEKESLFAAVTRLGRDDLPGIAAQICTKTVLEVRQYLMLLQDASLNRRGGKAKHSVTLLDHPSAIEVDQDLCNALEAVADDLSLRQQAYEEIVEQHRWGDTCWLITPAVARNMEAQVRRRDPDIQVFGEFFKTKTWLHLSEHIFMNAAIEDCNWNSVSEEKPAIRTTALEDFYSLAKSITRRLLATTLIMANSRLRRRPSVKLGSVKVQDVKAAMISLNMTADSRRFWAQSARRLRLNVLDDEVLGDTIVGLDLEDQGNRSVQANQVMSQDDDAEDDSSQASYNSRPGSQDDDLIEPSYDSEGAQSQAPDDEEGPYLSYDRVEELLGYPPQAGPAKSPDVSDDSEDGDDDDSADEEISIYSEDSDPPNGNHQHQNNITIKTSRPHSPCLTSTSRPQASPSLAPTPHDIYYPIDPAAVEKDLEEAIYHSAIDFAGTTRARDTLRTKIAAEHTLHSQADARDAAASRSEEARLWAVLREEELPEEPNPTVGRMKSADLLSTDDEGFMTDGTTAGGGKTRGTRKPGTLVLDGGSAGGGEMDTDVGGDWRAKIQYCSEWLTEARLRRRRNGELE